MINIDAAVLMIRSVPIRLRNQATAIILTESWIVLNDKTGRPIAKHALLGDDWLDIAEN